MSCWMSRSRCCCGGWACSPAGNWAWPSRRARMGPARPKRSAACRSGRATSAVGRFRAQGTGEVSPRVLGRALACRAEIAFDLQDYDVLLRYAPQGLELSRGCGDEFAVPIALRVISQAALRAGRFSEAVA